MRRHGAQRPARSSPRLLAVVLLRGRPGPRRWARRQPGGGRDPGGGRQRPGAAAGRGRSPLATAGAAAESSPDTRGLDQEIQDLKKDVVDLNKDLFILEEELLFPANTQVAVFLSVEVGPVLRARFGAAED